ncbi:hypothetical protein BBJ29_009342 [Phytophthora kernoviae]|uniref:Uncharacterized protein n=1 Tax=Phytophthora kernoviae TaxID=325452 RepID=A0A421FU68_9STRA|nr:hypothetical protein BBJ29_009342 [Phytophthora kernoviae]
MPQSRTAKKRKATYLVRKEEQESLQEQIQTLQQQLQDLQDNGETQRRDLYASVGENAALKDAVDQQHFAVAGAQSLMSEWLQNQNRNPMRMHIHLGQEWTARRETLLAMKDERLARGFRYVTARCQHLAPLKPQFSEERFEDANGDTCCIRNEVIPFPGVESLKKVFDAVRFTIDTLEIAVSEQLGHMTLRDDYDTVDDGTFISNYRLVSGLDCGVTAELNAVVMGQYVETGKVTRKKAKSIKGDQEEEVVIVMMRSLFMKTCHPEFDISEAAMQEFDAVSILIRYLLGTELLADLKSVLIHVLHSDNTSITLTLPMYVEPDSFQTLLLSDVPSDNLTIPPSSNSSPSPSAEAPKKPQTKKKRKATYLLRKEEQSALQEEIERLESQVAVLRTRNLPPEEAAKADPVLQKREAENAALTSVLRHQQLHVANAQSLLSRCLGEQQTHPLYTKIRLTKDWPERRAMLRAIRAEKLRNAYEYIMARSCHSQPEKMQLSDERFESTQGDLCCVRFETVYFRGVESLEQVYNALIFYLTNMEISISERLGHITVRDDYDSIEGTAYNSRIASTEDCGVTMEMNAVSFPQLFAKDELGVGVGPCAVLASDCVDEDELYPYNPSERVRKDVSGAVVLTVSRRKPKHKNKGVGATLLGEESEVVVTMQRAAFVKLHRPQFPVSAFALQELHEGIARWGDVMLKTVRSVVYTTP